ncbi:uncharacterized protein E0L32_002905 [Thyridium curvatum]|uniref:Nudix hydrolase domain-containing protein n=1 Tax=Thyridium curvatum TaxID=1093900 RepID=A0A507BGA7_9PEZI|nr:uncharacterized protein E0L32_002905 [Thyridium curvatum]TPX17804.1 hypothetical protein E0L32_002905 [Thyridium curvatum]
MAATQDTAPKTFLDLINDCDSFPDIDIAQTPYSDDNQSAFYQFLLPNDPRPHGYMVPSVVERMPWTADFKISPPTARPRTVQLIDTSNGSNTSQACNKSLLEVVEAAKAARIFEGLRPRPNYEDYKVIGANFPVQLQRSAAPLFGIANRGAHLNIYTVAEDGALKFWVPRRSAHIRTWPGMLDNAVAGGVRAEESPFECIVHEADEEASLPEELIRTRARATGVITYVSRSAPGSGAEIGLMVPDCIYTFDLQVGPDEVPRPRDEEVQEFYLWSVDQVKEALARGEFKPNCALVMIDFFIRRGVITEDNEQDYLQLVTRLHRTLPVPTVPAQGR